MTILWDDAVAPPPAAANGGIQWDDGGPPEPPYSPRDADFYAQFPAADPMTVPPTQGPQEFGPRYQTPEPTLNTQPSGPVAPLADPRQLLDGYAQGLQATNQLLQERAPFVAHYLATTANDPLNPAFGETAKFQKLHAQDDQLQQAVQQHLAAGTNTTHPDIFENVVNAAADARAELMDFVAHAGTEGEKRAGEAQAKYGENLQKGLAHSQQRMDAAIQSMSAAGVHGDARLLTLAHKASEARMAAQTATPTTPEGRELIHKALVAQETFASAATAAATESDLERSATTGETPGTPEGRQIAGQQAEQMAMGENPLDSSYDALRSHRAYVGLGTENSGLDKTLQGERDRYNPGQAIGENVTSFATDPINIMSAGLSKSVGQVVTKALVPKGAGVARAIAGRAIGAAAAGETVMLPSTISTAGHEGRIPTLGELGTAAAAGAIMPQISAATAAIVGHIPGVQKLLGLMGSEAASLVKIPAGAVNSAASMVATNYGLAVAQGKGEEYRNSGQAVKDALMGIAFHLANAGPEQMEKFAQELDAQQKNVDPYRTTREQGTGEPVTMDASGMGFHWAQYVREEFAKAKTPAEQKATATRVAQQMADAVAQQRGQEDQFTRDQQVKTPPAPAAAPSTPEYEATAGPAQSTAQAAAQPTQAPPQSAREARVPDGPGPAQPTSADDHVNQVARLGLFGPVEKAAREGKPDAAIAKALGLSESQVKAVRERLGIVQPEGAVKPDADKTDDELIDELMRDAPTSPPAPVAPSVAQPVPPVEAQLDAPVDKQADQGGEIVHAGEDTTGGVKEPVAPANTPDLIYVSTHDGTRLRVDKNQLDNPDATSQNTISIYNQNGTKTGGRARRENIASVKPEPWIVTDANGKELARGNTYLNAQKAARATHQGRESEFTPPFKTSRAESPATEAAPTQPPAETPNAGTSGAIGTGEDTKKPDPLATAIPKISGNGLPAHRARIEALQAKLRGLTDEAKKLDERLNGGKQLIPHGDFRSKQIERLDRLSNTINEGTTRLEAMMDDYFTKGGKEPDHARVEEETPTAATPEKPKLKKSPQPSKPAVKPDPFAGERFRLVNRESGSGDQTPPKAPQTDFSNFTPQALRGMKYEDVRDAAKVLGVDTKGTREVLAKRILEKQEGNRQSDLKSKLPSMKWFEVEKMLADIQEAEGPQQGYGYGGNRTTSREATPKYTMLHEALTEKMNALRAHAEAHPESFGEDVVGGEKVLGSAAREPGYKSPTDKGNKPATPEKMGAEIKRLEAQAELPTEWRGRIEAGTPDRRGSLEETGIQKLKEFMRAVPEFKIDPAFIVTADGKLRFRDGGQYTFEPEAIGIKADADWKPEERIRIDADAVMKAKPTDRLIPERTGDTVTAENRKAISQFNRVRQEIPAAIAKAKETLKDALMRVEQHGKEMAPETKKEAEADIVAAREEVGRLEGLLTERARAPEARKAEVAAKEEIPETPKAIADFGDKIGGARKDMWAGRGLDVADLDKMNDREMGELVSKDQVFPKPDYQQLVEKMQEKFGPVFDALIAKPEYKSLAAQGITLKDMAAGNAFQVKQIRDAILNPDPNWPREKMAQYIRAVHRVRAVLQAYIENPTAMMEKLPQKMFGEDIIVRDMGRFNKEAAGYADAQLLGNKLLRAIQIQPFYWAKETLALRKTGWPTPREKWQVMFNIKQNSDGTFYVVSASKYRIYANKIPTMDEAIAKAKELASGKKGGPEVPTRPQLLGIKREGMPDYRGGKDVSEAEFQKQFGFRGGEFGNWNSQADRQAALNYAYDGLMDLAKVMNVPPKAISLNGELAIAFGARGHGHYAAHYEPNRIVINLTKPSGAGSLAHEWLHAMDDYFGRLSGNKSNTNPYVSEGVGAGSKLRPEMAVAWKDFADTLKSRPMTPEEFATRLQKSNDRLAGYVRGWAKNILADTGIVADEPLRTLIQRAESGDKAAGEEFLQKVAEAKGRVVSKDVRQSFMANVNAVAAIGDTQVRDAAAPPAELPKTATSYVGEAQLLDANKQKPYWSTGRELAARAFESYVFDRIADQGRSDYLVHGVEGDRYADKQKYQGNPYPTGDERHAINAALDRFVKAIQLKEENGNVAMFSKGPIIRTEAELQAMTWGQLQEIRKEWNVPAGGKPQMIEQILDKQKQAGTMLPEGESNARPPEAQLQSGRVEGSGAIGGDGGASGEEGSDTQRVNASDGPRAGENVSANDRGREAEFQEDARRSIIEEDPENVGFVDFPEATNTPQDLEVAKTAKIFGSTHREFAITPTPTGTDRVHGIALRGHPGIVLVNKNRAFRHKLMIAAHEGTHDLFTRGDPRAEQMRALFSDADAESFVSDYFEYKDETPEQIKEEIAATAMGFIHLEEVPSFIDASQLQSLRGIYADILANPPLPANKPMHPLFARAAEILNEKMPESAYPVPIRVLLLNAGIKLADMQQIGLDRWLGEKKGPVAKADVLEFLRQNARRASFSKDSFLDEVRGLRRDLRERFGRVEARTSPAVARGFIETIQAGPAAETIVKGFLRRAFAGAPAKGVTGATPGEEFIQLGYSLRGDEMELRKGSRGSLPALGSALTARLLAQSYMQKAIAAYNKELSPLITDIRTRNAMLMNPNAQYMPFFLNLAPDAEGNVHNALRGVNANKKFNRVASGDGDYEADPQQMLSAAIAGHLKTDAMQKLNAAIRSDAAVPKPGVVPAQIGGKLVWTDKYGYRKDSIVALDISPTDAPTTEIVYVPEILADEYAHIRRDVKERKNLYTVLGDAAMRSVLVTDFGPHTARIIGHVAGRIAQSGQSVASVLPSWLGSNEHAVKRMTEMNGATPLGETMQILLDKTGGSGKQLFDLEPGKNAFSKVLGVGHFALTHPDYGVDPSARRVIADAYLRMSLGNDFVDGVEKDLQSGAIIPTEAVRQVEAQIARQFGPKADAETIGLARMTNGTMGFANRQVRSELLNAVQKLFPFAGTQSGMIPHEIVKLLTANFNPKGVKTAFQQHQYARATRMTAGMLASGTLGLVLLMNLLNLLTSKAFDGESRFMFGNDEGHTFDLYLGKNWYWSNLDPGFSRASRLTGVKDQDFTLSHYAREGLNEAMSSLQPLLRSAFTLLSGKATYLTKSDRLMNAPNLSGLPLPTGRETLRNALNDNDIGEGVIKDLGGVVGVQLKHDEPSGGQPRPPKFKPQPQPKAPH